MSRIQAAFNKRLEKNQKAFIPFITAGDPSMDKTEEFILTLADSGADIIEIGVPFSDPAADGPVIMKANVRAMEKGGNIHNTFEMLERVRTKTDVPLVFLIYCNLIYSYGTDKFFAKCKEIGMNGVIIADAPFEEEGEFSPHAKANGIELIRLVSPTSSDRTKAICSNAGGFLYCVSSMGVTGIRQNVSDLLSQMFDGINKYCKIPTAIGFGIADADSARKVKDYADGVIIGSALVSIIEEHAENASPHLARFTKSIRGVLDENSRI